MVDYICYMWYITKYITNFPVYYTLSSIHYAMVIMLSSHSSLDGEYIRYLQSYPYLDIFTPSLQYTCIPYCVSSGRTLLH